MFYSNTFRQIRKNLIKLFINIFNLTFIYRNFQFFFPFFYMSYKTVIIRLIAKKISFQHFNSILVNKYLNYVFKIRIENQEINDGVNKSQLKL